MTKRITILATCLLAGAADDTKGQPAIGYPGSTIDVDDNTAGLLVVAGKAKYDKDAKLKDTAKAHEAELEDRAKSVVTPEAAMAAAVAQGVATALAAMGIAKPAAAAPQA